MQDPKNYRYTPTAGLPELRKAIADKTLRDSGYGVDPNQVIVTNGGKQAVYESFKSCSMTATKSSSDAVLDELSGSRETGWRRACRSVRGS